MRTKIGNLLNDVLMFLIGALAVVIVILGLFIKSTVGVYTQTKFVYNPYGITNMLGGYIEH